MMTILAALTLTLATAVQQTDTIVDLAGATRLEVDNVGGQVVVRTWDRDAIRIQAEHSSRTYVDIGRTGNVLEIESEADRGRPSVVDYDLTVPAGLNLSIEGMYNDVIIEGVNGEVEVETLQGNIRIVGGRGSVVAESTTGTITIEGAEGSIEAEAVSGGVEIVDSSGELLVESVGGSIIMRGISASLVEATTVGGRVQYEGEIQDNGRYFFGSHGGRVTLQLAPGVNASVTAVSLTGQVRVDYPGAPDELSARERDSFTLGTGSARIEAETFSGSIVIERKGSVR